LALLSSTPLSLFPHSLTPDLTFFSFTHFLIITYFYFNIFILVSLYPVTCFHMVMILHLYALDCSVNYLFCLRFFAYLLMASVYLYGQCNFPDINFVTNWQD
jgi:hypothetical protein